MPDEARCTVNVTIHPWCSDPSRDAAVRAAEDGRTGPLPTLGECIDAVTESMSKDARGEKMDQGYFAEAAECSVPVSKTVEGQSGMRTERVTLEVVHGAIASVNDQRWWHNRLWIEPQKGESVRVVDEPSSDADSEMLRRLLVASEMRRLKVEAELEAAQAASGGGEGEMSRAGQIETLHGTNVPKCTERDNLAASGGGEGEPMAWGVTFFTNQLCFNVYSEKFEAEAVCERINTGQTDYDSCTVVPLYAAHPQPRGWLTEEERGIIAGIADDDEYTEEGQNIAKALLASSSPPEVEHPECHFDQFSGCSAVHAWNICAADFRKALAAAGVAVKEVGK